MNINVEFVAQSIKYYAIILQIKKCQFCLLSIVKILFFGDNLW